MGEGLGCRVQDLPRVIYHHVYWYTKILGWQVVTLDETLVEMLLLASLSPPPFNHIPNPDNRNPDLGPRNPQVVTLFLLDYSQASSCVIHKVYEP